MQKLESRVITNVLACARCGKRHLNVAFERMLFPHAEFEYWAACPTNGQPILLKLMPEASKVPAEEVALQENSPVCCKPFPPTVMSITRGGVTKIEGDA